MPPPRGRGITKTVHSSDGMLPVRKETMVMMAIIMMFVSCCRLVLLLVILIK